MWPDLEEQIAVEEAEIRELVAFHQELLAICRTRAPVGIELTASGAFLHALYSGIENICRRIAIELDGKVPKGGDWHRRLLRVMTQATVERPRVISDDLHSRLLGYLDFRHLFRNIYIFRMDWERMKDLVLGAENLVEDLLRELEGFIMTMNEMSVRNPSDRD